MRTLEEIKRDLHSYKALIKRQQGATLYAEKYVEDVGALVEMIEGEVVPAGDVPQAAQPSESKKKGRKEKAPKPE